MPSRSGGTEEIEFVSCAPNFASKDNSFTVSYAVLRYAGGRWHEIERRRPGFWENEVFPSRADFP